LVDFVKHRYLNNNLFGRRDFAKNTLLSEAKNEEVLRKSVGHDLNNK
jgi:hypothetical protein